MNFFGYYVLNQEPNIIACFGMPIPEPDWIRPRAMIEHVTWWHGSLPRMLVRKWAQMRFDRTGVVHSLMVHAPDEERQRQRLGVRGAFVSQNIYIDARTFSVAPTEKLHDAVYVAQLMPFKRHELARDVERAVIVTGHLDPSKLAPYIAKAPGATFPRERLSKAEIAELFNASVCTLALSAVEGGMLASFESLLCGVPVVSTPSKGGRDVFFDEQNSVIVEPTAAAVAAGVEALKRTPRDPHAIRASALAKLEEHKLRFCDYVSDLSKSLGGRYVEPKERYEAYFGRPEGLSAVFIWADKFDDVSAVERVRTLAPRG